MKTFTYCDRCCTSTKHIHFHDTAYGMPWARSESYKCNECGWVTHSDDLGSERFRFVLDKAAQVSNLIVFYKYGVKVFVAHDDDELATLIITYVTELDCLGYAVLKVQSE